MYRKPLLFVYFCISCLLSYTTNGQNVSKTNVGSKYATLSADFNRDGKIVFSQQLTQNGQRTDLNTEKKPYVFWVNNDDDDETSETSGYDVTAKSGWFEFDGQDPDIDNNFIDGSRDLIDFFPVGLSLHKYLTTTADYAQKSYWLQHEDEAVNVVFTVMSRGEGAGDAGLASDYLKKIAMSDVRPIFGSWQTTGQLSEVPVYKVTRDGVEIPSDFIELIKGDEYKGVVLIEGSDESIQPLRLIIKDENNNQIVEASLPLRIYDVTRLFRQISLRGTLNGMRRDEVSRIWGETPTNVVPDVSTLLTDLSTQKSDIALRSPELDIDRHVIHVHGFNNDEKAATAFQSETFKRLFHSGSNALFTGVHWRGDEGFVAGLNYWGNVENAFYVADDLAELVNGISGNRIIIAHSLGNMVAGSAIQDFGMGFDKYFMLNPAVALEAYSLVAQPIQMRHPDWDEYYFGDDYNASLDTENYSGVRTDGKNGRRLWSTEWYTLLPSTDERYKLTWRNRFASVSASTNVIQYYSSGEEVLRAAQPGEPDSLDPITGYLPGNDTPIGLNAWNIQEKSKGTGNLAAFLGGGASVGWGFNEECETDQFGNEVCIPNNFLTHNLAQAFFDKTDDELVQTPFFDPFDNLLLMDINAGSAAVGASLPHNLAYEIPALSFAAGGTVSQQFFESGNTVDMNNEMFDGWPASRGGVDGKGWWHSDFKDVSYRYTYKLFNDIVSEGSLQ